MSDLAELRLRGSALGIHPNYSDAFGNAHETSETALRAILQAMQMETPVEGEQALFPPSVVAYEDDVTIALATNPHFRPIGQLQWSLTLEDGSEHNGGAQVEGEINLPGPLPVGYHRLTVSWGGSAPQTCAATLLVAPRRCFQPDALRDGQRRWGISLQLYALRSARNWGIGDFSDLLTLACGAARLGAACIGLNPLHALFESMPEDVSPYSPNSRLFLNTLYIDPEAIPEFADSAVARQAVSADEFQARLAAARRGARVDYSSVAACKHLIFRVLYKGFREVLRTAPTSDRVRVFRAFQEKRGKTLRDFAVFQLLRIQEDFDPLSCPSPDSPTITALVDAHLPDVEYHEYLQWEADRQLAAAQAAAVDAGMSIGLYCDLAVGTNGWGAEAWAQRDFIVQGVSVGAPPDMMNSKGQNWGLPPYNPVRLRDTGYAPLRALLAANMRRGGALRIDHILGFMRLFWIPAGLDAREGTYVNYPWAELLAVMAIESNRHRCMVIGEDLGTVPAGFSDALLSGGILGTRVFYFERAGAGFRPFSDYPVETLVTVATHDLPTFAAYWKGEDIALRDRLGLYNSANDHDWAIGERNTERAHVGHLLGVAADADAQAPTLAMYRALGDVPSKLVMVQLEDIAGQIDQVNLPGTWMEYPNWRSRNPTDVAEVLASDTAESIARALAPGRGDGRTLQDARPTACG
jgi:(1->4)-alpha-D-glucan 1-alpha-D-glucosylmutase